VPKGVADVTCQLVFALGIDGHGDRYHG
jgi:hypothetical protein